MVNPYGEPRRGPGVSLARKEIIREFAGNWITPSSNPRTFFRNALGNAQEPRRVDVVHFVPRADGSADRDFKGPFYTRR